MATDEEIEKLAQQLYSEHATAAQKAHRQGIVPWHDLGETFKESLRRMVKEQLEAAK